MGKHIQEDSYYGKMGFNALRIGENIIAPENSSAELILVPGHGISLVVSDNKVIIEATLPIFDVKEW